MDLGQGTFTSIESKVPDCSSQLLSTASYQLPTRPVPVHDARCHAGSLATAPVDDHANGILKFIVFKAARTGSTWASGLLSGMLSQSQITFEPYCRRVCHRRTGRDDEEKCLARLLSFSCRGRGSGQEGVCAPCSHCREHRVASAGIFVNARFLDEVRWWRVLRLVSPASSDVRVVNLRRTNLVRLAISQFLHAGKTRIEPFGNASVFWSNTSKHVIGDPEAFVKALATYAIDDQEYGSARAYAMPAHVPKHLVLYEDMVRQPSLVLKQLARFLGLQSWEDIRVNATEAPEVKRRSTHLCERLANCDDVLWAWRRRAPCLRAQLLDELSVAWTMPVEPFGKVGTAGSCRILPHLRRTTNRSIAMLYPGAGTQVMSSIPGGDER